MFLKVGSRSRLEGFPRLGVIIVGHIRTTVIRIVSIAIIGLPCHCFLTGGLNFIGQVSCDIPWSIVDFSVFRYGIPDVVREYVLAWKCRVKIGS